MKWILLLSVIRGSFFFSFRKRRREGCTMTVHFCAEPVKDKEDSQGITLELMDEKVLCKL